MGKLILCFDSYQATNQTNFPYTFEGQELTIIEGNSEDMHRVSLLTEGPDYLAEQIQTLYRFISSLCWKYKSPVYIGGEVFFGNNGGDSTGPKRFNRILGFGVPTNVFEPISDQQRIVLGLYREAKSSDSPFYSFLAYYKILESHINKESVINDWINNHLEHITEHRSQLEEIHRTKPALNIGRRIIDLRNGIAHAVGGKQPIDVDGYKNLRELNMLRMITEELSEHLMIKELGFPQH